MYMFHHSVSAISLDGVANVLLLWPRTLLPLLECIRVTVGPSLSSPTPLARFEKDWVSLSDMSPKVAENRLSAGCSHGSGTVVGHGAHTRC